MISKKGQSLLTVIIGVIALAGIITPIINTIISLRNTATISQEELEKMSIAYSEFANKQQEGYSNLITKANKTETVASSVNGYIVTFIYGNSDGTSLPITISVNKKNSLETDKPYTLSNNIYTTQHSYADMQTKLQNMKNQVSAMKTKLSQVDSIIANAETLRKNVLTNAQTARNNASSVQSVVNTRNSEVDTMLTKITETKKEISTNCK